jgi:thiamine biosynthesis protein ThiI
MIIVRYGEIGLKGKLRKKFEDLLISNIRRVLSAEGYEAEITREWGRIYILSNDERIAERVARVFGVVSTSMATETNPNMDEIVDKAVEVASKFVDSSKSFAVRARRAGHHPFTSMDVAREAGAAIKAKTKAKVDLTNPDVEIGIEVRESRALIYASVFKGFGGLPVGSQERVLSLISDEKSFLSTWYALRRGCDVDLLVTEDVLYVKEEILPWACYRDVGVQISESSDLKDMLVEAFSTSYPAVFCSITSDDIGDYIHLLRRRKMPVLMPLLSFDEGVIERKIHELNRSKMQEQKRSVK